MKKGPFIIITLGILLLNSSIIQIDTLRDLFNLGTWPRMGSDVVYSLLILNKVGLYSVFASGESVAHRKVRLLKGYPGSTNAEAEIQRTTIKVLVSNRNLTYCLCALKMLYDTPSHVNYYIS